MYLCMYVNRNQVNFVRKKKEEKTDKNKFKYSRCLLAMSYL